MIKKVVLLLLAIVLVAGCKKEDNPRVVEEGIINHYCTDLQSIPSEWLTKARTDLHIVYEHTSHGSQIIDGMTGLAAWKGSAYAWNNGGTGGALDIHDHGITGWSDLGNPDFTSWAASTRTYLNNNDNSDVNVVMWAWCGQVSGATEENINTYLDLMSDLEEDFPEITFVYMTGHLDGTGLTGNLHLRNEQIRNYCRTNKKFLFDFEDIESYDPDGVYYGDKKPNDGCNYDFDNDGTTESTGDPSTPTGGDKNWAIDWQNSHTVNTHWYNTPVQHSQPLNGNLKAYAAWNLWARIAGWDGESK